MNYKPLFSLSLAACVAAGCGGPGGLDAPPRFDFKNFTVVGSEPPVNGRAQIVAGVNGGAFEVHLDIGTAANPGFYIPKEVTLWISDQPELEATDKERKIADYFCQVERLGTQQPCIFNWIEYCTFSASNRVQCMEPAGPRPNLRVILPEADISHLLSGSQTGLFMVVAAHDGEGKVGQQAVLVNFRYN